MSEVIFEILQEEDGGFCAWADVPTGGICTQADTWEELRANVQDAVRGFYFDEEKPACVCLHAMNYDELLEIAEEGAEAKASADKQS